MALKDKLPTDPYKGVRDFYPEEQAFMRHFTDTVRAVLERAGYVEYGASVLEPAELYRAKGAENEEIVNEQTYTFADRGGREVTLRPEMTPSVARMVAARRREFGFPLRLYSIPNVFRYERPQRGRLREHWQVNADIFGSRSPYADAEILRLAYDIMRAFGAKNEDFSINVGSRASMDEFARKHDFSEGTYKKFRSLLDASKKMPSEEFELAFREFGVDFSDFKHAPPPEIEKMLEEFNAAGMTNVLWDPGIVRGFDYYTGMVFEVFDTNPQNNRSLFGGGRFDDLTALFDDEKTPGVGFGMGDVTMRQFLEARGLIPAYLPPTRVYLAVASPTLASQAQAFAGALRREGINTAADFGEKKLSDQIKAAAKHRIPYLIVFGEDELATRKYTVRDLASGKETAIAEGALAAYFLNA